MGFDKVFNADTIYVSKDYNSPQRKFYIYHTGIDRPRGMENNGWAFVVDQRNQSGEWQPVWDTWKHWFYQIIRYPERFYRVPLLWINEATGEVVDLVERQPIHDGKFVWPDQTPEEAGLSYLPADWSP